VSNAPTLMFDDKARRTSNFSDGSLSQDDRAGRDDQPLVCRPRHLTIQRSPGDRKAVLKPGS
jgi:hypothetical protein